MNDKIQHTGKATRIMNIEAGTTLIDCIHQNALALPNQVFLHWVNKRCDVTNKITYKDLWDSTVATAALLLRNGVKEGDRVMIAYPFGLEFLSGFFGCIRVGAIPCSVYPPNPSAEKSKAKHSFAQFNNQTKDAGAEFGLTTAKFKLILQAARFKSGYDATVKFLATDKLRPLKVPDIDLDVVQSPEDLAFIQYSSGSTGTPKGIMISHRAIQCNVALIRDQMLIPSGGGRTIGVSWLPQYHDYSLVCFNLLPSLLPGHPCYNTSPIEFIRNPLLWADMIDKFRPTITAGPNFSYGLLCKRMRAAGRVMTNCSLSCTNIAAEPIMPTTIDELVRIGFPSDSITPCYGLAESCAYVACCVGKAHNVVDGLVSCGDVERFASPSRDVVTIDNDDKIICDGSTGEICIRGPDLASGYWGKPEETQKAFNNRLEDGYLYYRTGDLGRIVDGKLYVSGRIKELIIINGKNVYPTDLERTVEGEFTDLVRPGSTVAYQHSDSCAGIAIELRNTANAKESSGILSAKIVCRLLADAHDVPLGSVVLLKQGTVPKTTSGKLRRVEARSISIEGRWKPSSIIWSWEKQTTRMDRNDSGTDGQSESKAESAAIGDEIDTIFKSIMGNDLDEDASWENNGLSSVTQAELSCELSRRVSIDLPTNAFLTHHTPAKLREYVKKNAGHTFPVNLPALNAEDQSPLPLPLLMLLQGIGVLLQLFVLTTAFATAFFVGKATAPTISVFEVGNSGRYVQWSWALVIVPTFMMSLSLIVVTMKWVVVGRYRTRQVAVFSRSFVTWWLVDRLVHLWELWVGAYIIDTPLMWLFYRIMGANIHPRTTINGFIREFDLVSIGPNTNLKHRLRCRQFGPWSEETGAPTLRFRPVSVGGGCLIEGMVGLGSKVANDVHVEKLCTLPEGAQVPSGSRAVGNPAFEQKVATTRVQQFNVWLESTKVLWLLAELYIFFGLFLVAQIVWNDRLPESFRYTPLLYWILLLITTPFLSLILSVVLKWVLSGRRTPEQRLEPTFRTTVTDWVCDYHFFVSISVLYLSVPLSRIWNVLLMAHGLDVDIQSAISDVFSITPSDVDQLKIRKSFLSTWIRFRPGEQIEICESTIGHSTVLSDGVIIHRSNVLSLSEVSESLYDHQQHPTDVTVLEMVVQEVVSLIYFILGCITFVPAYEVFQATASTNGRVGLALLGVAASITVQSIAWTLLCRLWQMTSLLFQRLGWKKIFKSSYHSCFFAIYVGHLYSQWPWLWGTPFYSWFLRWMGATVEGDLLFFGNRTYDFQALVFRDKTIVDGCHINGHYQIGNQLVVGKCIVAGVLHDGCFTMAGTVVRGSIETETGPWRAMFSSLTKNIHETDHTTFSHSDKMEEREDDDDDDIESNRSSVSNPQRDDDE